MPGAPLFTNQFNDLPRWGQSYTYDGFGNLTQQTVTKGTAPSLSVTYDPATNRQTGGECADANGNLNASSFTCGGGYIYDVENRIVAENPVWLGAQPTVAYSYKPGNKRVWKGNRGYAYTTIISSKYHGQTLLSHLASLYPHSTPQAWQQKLNNGEVTLNGVTATGSESVTLGQTLVWNRPPWIEPDSPRHFEILFEDSHLLAVNKPSGLPTLPGGGFMENTLLRLVQKQTPNANPVHRLGRATTGIVLFAKTPQAASNLFANWNTPKIQKIYRALAQNIAQHDAYEILTPIGLVPHPLIGSVWAANPSGKPSKSLAKVISRTTSTTTFEVSLNSGRPHQIRIHLASIGHPLVGDPLYGLTGQPLENLPGLPGDGGYFLHAQFLKFHHPITGEQINLEAALPSGFSLHL